MNKILLNMIDEVQQVTEKENKKKKRKKDTYKINNIK